MEGEGWQHCGNYAQININNGRCERSAIAAEILFNLNSCVNVASGNTTRCGTKFGRHFGLNN